MAARSSAVRAAHDRRDSSRRERVVGRATGVIPEPGLVASERMIDQGKLPVLKLSRRSGIRMRGNGL